MQQDTVTNTTTKTFFSLNESAICWFAMFLTHTLPQTQKFNTWNSVLRPASLVWEQLLEACSFNTLNGVSWNKQRNVRESLRAHLGGLAEGQQRDAFNLLVLTSWEPQPLRHTVNFITCLFPFPTRQWQRGLLVVPKKFFFFGYNSKSGNPSSNRPRWPR